MSKFDKLLAYMLLFILLLSACSPSNYAKPLPDVVSVNRYVDTQYNNVCYYMYYGSGGVAINCLPIIDDTK